MCHAEDEGLPNLRSNFTTNSGRVCKALIDETTDLQIIFNGGTGGHDTLELVNGNLNSIEFRYVDPSTGSIRLNGSGSDFISYTGLEPVTSTVNATNVW